MEGVVGNDSRTFDRYDNSSVEFSVPFEEIDYLRRSPSHYAVGSLFIILIIVGVVTNVLGLASLVHFRMWLKHEGYVYLVAIFAANIGILLFDSTYFCVSHWSWRNFPPNTSDFMCKLWHFLMTIYFVTGWLSVALLFNVYLREHLTQRRRCGCPIFAAKYCTLFASKIVVGIIFGVVFILGLPYMGIFTLRRYPYGTSCTFSDNISFHALFWSEFFIMLVLPFVLFLPVILLLTLCMSRDGDQFGFSGIDDRSLGAEQFRTVAVTLSSMNLFSHFVLAIYVVHVYIVKLVSAYIHSAYAITMGLQPIFCFFILAEFRKQVLGKLRDVGCCKCLPRSCFSSGDVQGVRLQYIEENPE